MGEKANKQTIKSLPDGCFHIKVPDPTGREVKGIFWSRMYYAIPLEVSVVIKFDV
jgi:hypothetical protein